MHHVWNSQGVRLLSMQIISKAISSANVFQNTKVIHFIFAAFITRVTIRCAFARSYYEWIKYWFCNPEGVLLLQCRYAIMINSITRQSRNQIPPIVRQILRQAQDIAPCVVSLSNYHDEVKGGYKKTCEKRKILMVNTISSLRDFPGGRFFL